MNRDTETCYIHQCTNKGMLMYIACLCPNLVSVHFYAIPIHNFCLQLAFLACFSCYYFEHSASKIKPMWQQSHRYCFSVASSHNVGEIVVLDRQRDKQTDTHTTSDSHACALSPCTHTTKLLRQLNLINKLRHSPTIPHQSLPHL